MSNVDIQCADVIKHQHRPKKYRIRPVVTPIGPSISYVELTKGQWALIDANDSYVAGKHNWSATWNAKTQSFYAIRKLVRKGKPDTSIGLHVDLMQPVFGYVVDHRNGNPLDNECSANLRLATRSQNAYNVGLTKANKTGFKGVSWDKRKAKYRAELNVNGKNVFLGYRDDAKEAHALYCKAADELHGEFRRVA